MHKNIETKLKYYLDNEKFCELLDTHNITDLFAGVDELDIPWLIRILKEEGIEVPQTYLNMYDLSRVEFPEFSASSLSYDEPLNFNIEASAEADSLFVIKMLNLFYYNDHSNVFGNIDNIESFDDIFILHYFDVEKVKIYAQVLEPLEPESDISKYNAIKVRFVSGGQDTFLAFELKDKTFYMQTEDFGFEETGYNYRIDVERFLEVLNETFEWLNSITV